MTALPAGDHVVDVIKMAYEVDLPVLLEAPHGVGKSAILALAAERLGIGLIDCDLSLMEPPDLVGIPSVAQDGRTRYAPPAFLPTAESGLLVFEELNRCPRYMRAPCLQLLTGRHLNNYVLPAGWLPVAAINNAEDGYQVEELDEALLSRFLRIKIVPDRKSWVSWGKMENRVLPQILSFVDLSPGIFDEPVSNPRSWVYASNYLMRWEKSPGRSEDLLAAGLAGLLGEKWALAFLQFYGAGRQPLTATDIVEAYSARRAALRGWVGAAKLDLVTASLAALQRHLEPQRVYEEVIGDTARKTNVEDFFSDLTPDLRRQVRVWLKDRGFGALSLSRGDQ